MKPENPAYIRALFEKAKQGDRDAFGSIYHSYYTPIYRYVLYRTKSVRDSEDITHEVFLKALRVMDRFSMRKVSPLAFFYTIARNTLIDMYRMKRDEIVDEDFFDTIASTHPKPSDEVSAQEDIGHVRKAIASLPEEQKDVVMMRAIGELSYEEIAKVLKKSEQAIRQIYSRGLKSLRGILGPFQ